MGNNTKRKNPYHNLATEQFTKLNDEFYKNYNKEYYPFKLETLIKMIDSPKDYCEFSETSIGKLKYTREFNEAEVEKYAKTELSVTVYHCLESFLRLYMAHCSMSGCPWLDLAGLSLDKFNKYSNSLKKENFNISKLPDFTDEEVISTIFYRHKNVPEEITSKSKLSEKEIIDRYKAYITFAVSYFEKKQEYNSYKHGLHISQRDNGFSIGEHGKDENPLLSYKGDSLVYLQTIRDRDKNLNWNRTVKYIDYKQQASIIFVFGLLIDTIIELWSPEEKESYLTFPIWITIDEILKNSDSKVGGIIGDEIEGIQIMESSMSLLYYK